SEGDGSDGRAEVVDAGGRALARGAYSPDSQIVARLWTFDGREPDGGLIRERFTAARQLRERVLGPGTTGYRAVNSEGDFCPGVLLDIYGDTAVLELTTAGTEAWRAELEAAVHDVFTPRRLIVRKTGSSRDRGRERPSPQPSPAGRGRPLEPSPPSGGRGQGEGGDSRIPFLENGLHFIADVDAGQKTGFFLDQRENRSRLRALARGATVLNLFSYSGAFSVAALAGGASRAVDVDSSSAALALAREHRAANGFPAADADFVEADVFEDVRRRVAAGERWDVIVCDPPAFAKKKADVDRAARGYKDVNRVAMALVAPGGWLLTCSCSGLVSADLFQKIVFSASLDARASFAIDARQGAGPDHPVSLDCPEGEYLKGLWLRRA
ncbi:MAG TPA: class I SAM-dependent rRNA methyltransferase, partial [Thermoanaerobaculia bacterium]|nr:class I SAM-dependent rRNA methyltransferase [Thermoanaerobaculia bacterium]